MKSILILIALCFSLSSQAAKLSDFSPYKVEVRFTNPVCKTYKYRSPLESNDGNLIYSKTKNAYCKSSDSRKSAARKNSPHSKLIEWIKDESTKEIFLAYLSFSKKSIATELCNAIKYRNLKVTLIFDSKNEDDEGRMATANYLARCRAKNPRGEANIPVVRTTGNKGGLGYAHNKLFFVNPNSEDAVKIAFSSGNMSSGTVTHHENWNFITTNAKTHFVQAHKCLMKGMINASDTAAEFKSFIKKCRGQISVREESDIKSFFVPVEGAKAFSAIATAAKKAKMIEGAAHRFSYGKIVNMLSSAMKNGTDVRFIFDDDIYWTGVYRKAMGRNTTGEASKVRSLVRQGMKVKYIETYMDDVFEPKSLQLQHNKFLIFTFAKGGAVFAGAGNLTGTAFTKNFENFYYITNADFVSAFKAQYKRYWNDLGRSYEEMPTELILP